MFDLKGRNFLKLLDFSASEITGLVDLAQQINKYKKEGR